MSDVLRDWIMGLTTAAVLASCAQLLTPKGTVEKVTGFVCSLMLTAALLSPLMKLDMEVFSWSMTSYRQKVAELTEELEKRESRLLRSYIESQCAAYVLDEAHVLGVVGGMVEVSAEWECENWIPSEVTMTMAVTPEQKQLLSHWITAQLGIPEERQRWYGG